MALARLHTWVSAEVLYASDLNAEFSNILNNPISLISPLTASIDANGFDITGVDEVALNDAAGNATASGRFRRNGANLTWHDGTSAKNVVLSAVVAGAVNRTAGDVTTTSTSLTDLTAASISLSTAARRVRLSFICVTSNSTAPETNTYNYDVDGSAQLGTSGIGYLNQDTNARTLAVGLPFLTAALTAASHTFKVRWKVSGNTGTTSGGTATPYHFSAEETTETT